MMSQQVSFDWVSKQISSQLHLYHCEDYES